MPTKVWWEVPLDQEIEAIPAREYAPIFFPPEGAKAVFEFTENEFLKVLSALINGALVTYGDEWLQVVWYFLRSVDYPVSICELIIDCIENDADVQAILRSFITNDEGVRDFTERVVQQGAPISPEEAAALIVQTDNMDNLFGAITFLVDTMNSANIDLYEALEASTNNREGGQILFEAVPILETLPFDEASEYIDFLASSVAENYASEYTTTPITGLRDRIRCALRCIAIENDNSLSWEMIADYFWEQVGYTAGDYKELFEDFVQFVTTGSWSGEEIALISFANIASVLSASQEFSGMTFPSLAAIMQLGLNNPDPDWPDVCEECGDEPPETCAGFIGTEGGFEAWLHPISGLAAATHTPEGWDTGYNSGFSVIQREFEGETIVGVTIRLAEPTPEGATVNVQVSDLSGGSSDQDENDNLDEYVFTGLSIAGGLIVTVQTSTPWTSTQRITEVCWEFAP